MAVQGLVFLPVVRRLLDMTPPGGQRMLFSATLDAAVDVLARRFMDRPAHHDVSPVEVPVAMVHHLLTIAPADRVAVVTAKARKLPALTLPRIGDNDSTIMLTWPPTRSPRTTRRRRRRWAS